MVNERVNVAFVILHYLAFDVTINCIKSIQEVLAYQDWKIVVVDNGSPNGSGKKLTKLYADSDQIKVICLKTNTGFSVGNNVGYRFAREQLHADFIIVINNDVKMMQQDFVEKIISYFGEDDYSVLGPDVINLDGIHQSPQRDHVITRKEAKVWLLKRCVSSIYLHIHKKLKLSERFFIYKKYVVFSNKRKEKFDYRSKKENVELQGSCFVFSPLYLKNNEIAFEELTFMYCEEPLLSLRCARNRWKIVYNPSLKIQHIETVSTKVMNRNNIDKEIFYSDNHVKAICTLLKQMKYQK